MSRLPFDAAFLADLSTEADVMNSLGLPSDMAIEDAELFDVSAIRAQLDAACTQAQANATCTQVQAASGDLHGAYTPSRHSGYGSMETTTT